MNKLLAGIAGATLAFGVASADAAQINGSIGMSGTVTPNAPLATATALDFSPAGGGAGDFLVLQSTGDIAASGIAFGDLGSITDFSFNPFAGPILDFYTVEGLSFDLETLVIDTQNAAGIILKGTGTMSLTGFDDTSGVWIFSTQGGSGTGTFTWSADSFTTVPEPATLALFGAGLLGLGMVRRRKA